MGLFDDAGMNNSDHRGPKNGSRAGALGIGDPGALTDRLNDPATWKGTDDDVWWMRWRLKIKCWFAFSWTEPQGVTASFVFLPGLFLLPFTIWLTGWSWWYLFPIGVVPVLRRWRENPMIIFAAKGRGYWRTENTDAGREDYEVINVLTSSTARFLLGRDSFLSRCQYWTRWHVAIQWPFFVSGHLYLDPRDVLRLNERDVDLDGRILNFYRGWHKDADAYWGDGAFAGRNFK